MKDLLDILIAFAALPPGEPATLATVVRVEGSSYRTPGARMLIDAAGRRTGAVSGGCLEADIARRGRLLSDDQPNALMRYDGADEDASWNFNLGCNGSIEIFIERLAPSTLWPSGVADTGGGPARQSLDFLRDCINNRRPGAMLSVFAAPPVLSGTLLPGARLLLTSDSLQAQIAFSPLGQLMLADARASLQDGQTATATYHTPAGPVHALLEAVRPPMPLIIFGAGHDAVPLVHQAKQLGWHVTVCDRRASYARPDRFPQADAVIVADPAAALAQIPLRPEASVVIMTHHYPDDLALLQGCLAAPPRYVGLLGPRSRAQRLLDDAAHAGFTPTRAQLQKLHAPIGLDLGAEGPDPVAVSIVAEILAAAHGRPGAPLRQRSGSIHTPAAVWTSTPGKPPLCPIITAH